MGVLEDRQHLTTFTKRHPPFWTASVSRLGRITRLKTSSKKTRTLNGSLTGNAVIRPQSCPNIMKSHPQPKSRCVKPPLVLQQSTSRHIEHMKDNKHMQRPSTSPTKDNTSLSSCPPSEFTAWRDNDSSTKENDNHATTHENCEIPMYSILKRSKHVQRMMFLASSTRNLQMKKPPKKRTHAQRMRCLASSTRSLQGM